MSATYILEVKADPSGLSVLAKEFQGLEATIAATAKRAQAAIEGLGKGSGGGASELAAMRSQLDQVTAGLRTVQAENELLTLKIQQGSKTRAAALSEEADAHVRAFQQASAKVSKLQDQAAAEDRRRTAKKLEEQEAAAYDYTAVVKKSFEAEIALATAAGEEMTALRVKRALDNAKASLGEVEAENRVVQMQLAAEMRLDSEMRKLKQARVAADHVANLQEQGDTLDTVNKEIAARARLEAEMRKLKQERVVSNHAAYAAEQAETLNAINGQIAANVRADRAATGHTQTTKEQNAALNDLRSAARGAASGLSVLWATYGSSIPLLVGAFALTSAIKESITAAAQWQYQMTFVGSVARREGESMAQAMDRMKGIGHEALQMMQTSLFSPEQGAEGLRQLAQAGLSAEDALKTLPAVLNLATVGEESVGQAAFSTVTIMEAFHKTAGETGAVVDELAKAAAMSTTSVAGISESMKQASTVGEMFNISLEDTLGGLSLLADRGIRGTAAGTAWRQMIQGLYAPTEKQAQAMQKLGVQAYDADHNMRPLATIMGELRQKLSGYDKESQNNFMTALTDQRGMKALSAMMDQFDKFGQTVDEIKNKSKDFAKETTDALKSTTKGEWTQAMNSMRVAFIEAGEAASGPLHDAIVLLKEDFRSPEFKNGVQSLLNGFVSIVDFIGNHGSAIVTFVEALLMYKAGKAIWPLAVQGLAAIQTGMAGISAIALSTAARGGLVGLALFGGFELGEYLSKFQLVKDAMGEMFTPLFGVMAEMQKFFEKYDSKDRRVVKEGGFDENGNYAPAQYETNSERAARQAAEARAAQGSYNASGESRTLRQMEAGYTNTQAVRASSGSGGLPTGSSHYIPREQKQAEQEAEIAVTLENARYRREEADLKASYDTRMSIMRAYHSAGMTSDTDFNAKESALNAEYAMVAEQELRTHVTNLIAQRQILLGKHRDTAKIDADIAKANDDLNNTVLKNQTRAVSDAANEWKKFNEQTQSVIDTAEKGNVELKDEVEALKNHTKEKKDNILASLDARLVIEKETLARLESEQATWDICKALTAEQEAKKGEIETAKKAIDTMQAERNARKGLLTERKQLENNWINGAIKGLQDYEDKSLSTAKIMESAFKKAFTGLEDLIVNWVVHGKANIHEFLNSIGQDILRMLVKLNITQPIANFFQGLLSGNGSGSILNLVTGGGAPGSSGGGIGGLVNTASGIGSFGSFLGSAYTGASMGGMSGAAGAWLGTNVLGSAAAYSTAVPGLTYGGSQAAMLAAQTGVFGAEGTAATAAAGAGAAGAEGGLMAGLGATGWGLIVAAVILAIMHFAGQGGGPKVGGSFMEEYNGTGTDLGAYKVPGTDNDRFFTPDQLDSQLKKPVNDFATGFLKTVGQLGGKAPGEIAVGLGVDNDPNGSAQSRLSSSFVMDGKEIYSHRDNSMDDKAIAGAIPEEVLRMTVAGLKNVHFAQEIDDIFKDIDPLKDTVETLNSALQAAYEMKGVLDALPTLQSRGWNVNVEDIKKFSVNGESVGQTFQRISGEMDAFDSSFMTDAQKLAAAKTQLSDGFEKLGLEVPKSKKDFFDLVHGLDLSTQAGRDMFDALMLIAPAFQQVGDATDQLAQQAKQSVDAFNQAASRLSQRYGQSYAQANLNSSVTAWMGVNAANGEAGGWDINKTIAAIQGMVSGTGSISFADALAYAQSLGGDAVDVLTKMISAYGDWQDASNQSTQAYNDNSAAVNDFGQAALQAQKTLEDWAKSKLLSADSPLTPGQKFDTALSAYDKALKSGDMSSFQSAADDLLTQGRAYWASSDEYTALFNRVMADAQKLGGFKLDYHSDIGAASTDQMRKDLLAQMQLSYAQDAEMTSSIKDLNTAIEQSSNAAVTAILESARDLKTAIVNAIDSTTRN